MLLNNKKKRLAGIILCAMVALVSFGCEGTMGSSQDKTIDEQETASTEQEKTKDADKKIDSTKTDDTKADGTKTDGTKTDGTKTDSTKTDVTMEQEATSEASQTSEDKTEVAVTGWQIIDGQYYFYDRLTGERVVGQTVDQIEIAEDGTVTVDDLAASRISTMMKANQVIREITLPTDSMEEKRKKAFDWVLSFQYFRYRKLNECYDTPGIEVTFANDIFDNNQGDCVSEAAAVAFLFHEIGYENVYWCHDTGHSWVDLDGRLYDPLFAESKGYESNYDADYTDYRSNPPYKVLIY